MTRSSVTRQINKAVSGANAAAAAANQRAAAAEAAAAQARTYADEQIKALTARYEEQLSQDRTFTSLAEQIRALGGSQGGTGSQVSQPQAVNQALAALGSERNFGSSDLATRLNFQVSDEQILNDYNQAKLGRLNQLVQQGNAQIAGITERLNAAQTLANQLPAAIPAASPAMSPSTNSAATLPACSLVLPMRLTRSRTSSPSRQEARKPSNRSFPSENTSSFQKSAPPNSFARLIPTPTALRLGWVANIARWRWSRSPKPPRSRPNNYARPSSRKP